MTINDKQKQALKAICNAFVPGFEEEESVYWKRKATDIGVDEIIIGLLDKLTIEQQKDFGDSLNLLASPLLGLTWMGPLKPVHKLTTAQAEKMLQSWSNSRIELLRRAFGSLRKLVCYLYYGYSTKTEDNPNWKDIGYPGPYDQSPKPPLPLSTLDLKQDTTLSCDVVVVGSGSGGGIMAAELSKAGLEVIVVEKGPFVQPNDMNQREYPMIKQLFEGMGLCASKDTSVSILAGNCLGGGTVVNWAGMFRTPDFVLDEWAKLHGNQQFDHPEYKKTFESIEKRLATHQEPVVYNSLDDALLDGCKKLGYKTDVIPRNYKLAEDMSKSSIHYLSQGFSTLGDREGDKQSGLVTFLQDAYDNGTKLIADCYVDKVITENGKAKGIEGVYSKAGKRFKLKIKASRVVVSAGSLHTPALLKRSGLQHAEIGRNLFLHPVGLVSSLHDKPMEAWYGPMMAAVCDDFTQLDGNYGIKIETPPIHSGFFALVSPWYSARQHKQDMLNIKNQGIVFGMVRDKDPGQIKLSKQGFPLIDYKMSPYDLNHLFRGMQESVRIQVAAGAKQVTIGHNQRLRFVTATDNLETFLKELPEKRWALNDYSLYSAHQMGTCRMGDDNKRHPVKPNGETREISGLFVADTSVFPTCTGSNPMLSAMAVSSYVAGRILEGTN